MSQRERILGNTIRRLVLGSDCGKGKERETYERKHMLGGRIQELLGRLSDSVTANAESIEFVKKTRKQRGESKGNKLPEAL